MIARNVLLLFGILLVALGMGAVLHWEGRIFAHAPIRFWVPDAWGNETSQQLSDPYSFTHVLHGFIFFWATSFFSARLPYLLRLLIAVLIEAGWEILENSSLVINRYREGTASLGYTGDSIINSMGDVVSCIVGFSIASKLGFRNSLILFFVTEGILLLTIRDSLLMNILMLLSPVEELKMWQLGR